jgi:hypothetical protein
MRREETGREAKEEGRETEMKELIGARGERTYQIYHGWCGRGH